MELIYKLKWLSGPLTGRELLLPEGEFRIGGSDADAVLPLEDNVEAVLMVAADSIILTSATPVWVNGERWNAEQSLPLEQYIDLAGQGIVLGKPHDTLPLLPLPARRQLESTVNKHLLNPWLLLPITVLVLMTLGIVGYIRTHEDPPPFDPHRWLAETLQSPDLSGLDAQLDERGVVHLSGLSASSQSIMQLRKQLDEHGLNFYDQSIGTDALLERVRQLFTLHGYQDIEVKPGATAEDVEIFGAINADERWLKVNAQLAQIKQLKHWVVINDQAEYFQRLLDKLSKHTLLEGLSIKVTGKELLINGQLDEQRAKEVESLVTDFNHDGQSRLQARFLNIPTVATTNILPAAIVSIGGNGNSVYLQLANNMRLQQGAILPNGYKIYSLSQHFLTLIRGEHLISLPLNF